MKTDTLFYDGQCSLCSKEIAWLKQNHDGELAFCDIHQTPTSELPTDRQSMLKVLHLSVSDKNDEKQWLFGLDATVRAWSHTRYGFAFRPLRWPLIKPIADTVYARWATQRYEKRYACAECTIE